MKTYAPAFLSAASCLVLLCHSTLGVGTAEVQVSTHTSISDAALVPISHDISFHDSHAGFPAVLNPITFATSDVYSGGTASAAASGQAGLLRLKCSAGYNYVIRTATAGGAASGGGEIDVDDFVTVGSPNLANGTVVVIHFGMLLSGTTSTPWSAQLRPGIADYMFANMRAQGSIGDKILNITFPQSELHDLNSTIVAKVGETFSFRYSMSTACSLASDIADIRFLSCDFYGYGKPFVSAQNPNVTLVSASGFDYTQVVQPCRSDLNNDGQVDDSDFVLFVAAYNTLDCADPSMAVGCPADINGDGFVDDADFVLFVSAYDALLCS